MKKLLIMLSTATFLSSAVLSGIACKNSEQIDNNEKLAKLELEKKTQLIMQSKQDKQDQEEIEIIDYIKKEKNNETNDNYYQEIQKQELKVISRIKPEETKIIDNIKEEVINYQEIQKQELKATPKEIKPEEQIKIVKKEINSTLLKEMMEKYGNEKLITINTPTKTPRSKLKYFVKTKIAKLLDEDGFKFDTNLYSIYLTDLPNQKQLNTGNLKWQSGKKGTDRKVIIKITNNKTKEITTVKIYYSFNIK